MRRIFCLTTLTSLFILAGIFAPVFGTYQEPSEEAAQQPIVEEETPELDESSAPELAVEPEPEPADVAKLVEKWKDELAEKYKIGIDRFVVLFVHSDSFSNNMLETWVVPPGAALPNPEQEQPTKDPVPPAAVNGPSIKEHSERVPIGKAPQ